MPITNLIQGSEEWLKFRESHIGASDIAVISESNPWKTPYVLWKEMTGRKERDKINPSMTRGIELEPKARGLYEFINNIKLDTHVYVSDTWDIAMASLDGINKDETRGLEIKCPTSPKLYQMALKGKIPQYYKDQLQWQFFVVPTLEFIDFMVYIDDSSYIIIRAYPDKERQQFLYEKALEFYNFILTDLPPPHTEITFEEEDTAFANSLAEEWRKAKEEYDWAEIKLLKAEEKIKESFKKNCIFPSQRVKISWHTRKGNIDWEKYTLENNISEETLKEYTKEGIYYPKISQIS